MLRKNHLRLVPDIPENETFITKNKGFITKTKQIITKFVNSITESEIIKRIPFIKTQQEKIEILRKYYNRDFRNEDIKNNFPLDIPYFVRADIKLNEIIKENKVNIEYKRLCSNKKLMRCC